MNFEEYLNKHDLGCLRIGFTDQSNYQEIIGDMQLWNKGIKNTLPALQELADADGVVGCVILQKCNSVEFYTVSRSGFQVHEKTKSVWKKHAKNYQKNIVKQYGEHYQGEQVIEHLFKTACGIKSVVLGDNQVRGQVWDAYQTANQVGVTNVLLDAIFEYSKDVLAKVGTKTRFNDGYTSAERLAANKITKEISGPSVAILGAGDSGQLIAKCLTENGHQNIHVYTNSPEMAAPKLPDVNAVYNYDNLTEHLPKYRGLVAATSSTNTLVSGETERLLSDECLVIDISSPPVIDISRNIIGLNEISEFADKTIQQRMSDLNKVKTIIGRSVENCKNEINTKLMEQQIGNQLSDISEYEIDKSLQEFKSDFIWSMESIIRKRNYKRVNTPHIGVHPIDTVYSKTDLFKIDWFGKTAYLRPDTMIYELIYIMNDITPIYDFSTTFHRTKQPEEQTTAEINRFKLSQRSDTERDLLSECSDILIKSVRQLLSNQPPYHQDLTDGYAGKWWENETIPKIPYTRVADESNVDLSSKPQRERKERIQKYIDAEYGHDVYIITHYPESLSFITDRRYDGNKTHRFRVFTNEWEIASGALRETRPDVLRDRSERVGSQIPEPYLNIIQEREIHPYGGFSVGYERLVTRLLSRADIRDVVTFPRTYRDLKP